jgi:triacylglycerol lipase
MTTPLPSDVANRLGAFDFVYETTQYHPKIAYSMAKVAKLTYFSEPSVAEFVKTRWKFTNCQVLSHKETAAYLLWNDRMIVVSFRGSDDLQDWLQNFRVWLVPGPFGLVHWGFNSALGHIWDDLTQRIGQMQQARPRSLWLTGHSLGAALATLATARLRQQDVPVYGLYTFGSPRVGNRWFERTFNTDFKPRIFRFVNNNDTVTRIPTRSMGYSHVGNLFYWDTQGNLQTDPYFWLMFLDSVKGSAEDFAKPGIDGFNDHDLDRYLQRLDTDVAQHPQ